MEKQWYIDRIGKRVYRNKTTCDCETCNKVYNEGVIILDIQHAGYLYNCANELGIKYFDTIEETLKDC